MAVLDLARRGKTIEELEANEDFYPSSDGEPLGETDKHAWAIRHFLDMLTTFFHEQEEVYVAGNNFIYFERGDPSAVVSPDAYVIFEAGKELRDSYKLWEENALTPNVAIEFTSKKTKRVDTGKKRRIYSEVLKVPEYFLFDPQGDYLNPRLMGFSLHEGAYIEMRPNQQGRLVSSQLGLEFFADGDLLRIFDPITGSTLKTHYETTKSEESFQLIAEQERREKEVLKTSAELERREKEALSLRNLELEARMAEMERLRKPESDPN